MMDRRENLQSEVNQLVDILAGISPEAILDRMSFESRLTRARKQLEELPLQTIQPRTVLTFRGKPVRGSRGISAEFGGKAAKGFSDAYAAVVAGLKENLRYMGPIPDRASSDLMIVGTAIGSFGFEFALPAREPDLISGGKTIEQTAVEKFRSLLEVSASGTDEEISDIVEDIHPRAVKRISEFVGLLAQSDAMCALEISGRAFRFDSVDQVKMSSERLADNNIRESEDNIRGAFIGVLPKSRTFEFKVAEEDVVLRGKLAADIENPDDINSLIGLLRRVRFAVVQVGTGRPRYTLRKMEDIEAD